MSEDVTKLPKWAQQRIARAEANEQYAKDRLAETVKGDQNSPVVLVRGYRDDLVPLPQLSRIRFNLEHGHVEAYLNQGRVELYAGNTSVARLAVFPHVSNVVHVELIERGD